MDRIKGVFTDLTGRDGKFDSTDARAHVGDGDLGNLQARAEELGIGNLDLEALGRLDFPLDKAEIISALKTANVNQQLISLVEKVPDQVYESLAHLQEKLPI